MRQLIFLLGYLVSYLSICAQNGTLDQIEDLFTIKKTYVTTPDGASLATDLYLPITSDSLVIDIDIPGIGTGSLELLQRGVQYIYYPELDSMPNPNPFELPVVFTRTTYDIENLPVLGYIFSFLGYAVVTQDNRGINGSNDIMLPLYTDGWTKTPYTDYIPHLLLPDGYQGNPSSYEDGLYGLDFIQNQWTRDYDINEDGIVDFNGKVSNGSVFYFGASALANSGMLMALSTKSRPTQPGLKGFLNIIATAEHYNNTLLENGMFKEALLSGWINGQLGNFSEDQGGNDDSWYNFEHTFNDFGLTTRSEALKTILDLLSVEQAEGKAAYYPNNKLRAAFDASRAPVDENGMGDPNGAYSRYTNLDMPIYNVSGWWDIFLNGQLNFWKETKTNMDPNSPNYKKQKLIIGPWQHYYPAVQTAGDLKFPSNVGDVLGVTGDVDDEEGIIQSLLNLNLEDLLKSELFSFIRSSANFNEYKNIGTPQIRFPKNDRFQQLLGNILIKIPSEDYSITHADLINFLGGEAPLNFFPAKLYVDNGNDTIFLRNLNLSIPPLPDFITDIFGGISEEFGEFPLYRDFSEIPEVRYYVCGPYNDSIPENENVGNYWLSSDTFPIVDGIIRNELYLHNSGNLTISAPEDLEEKTSYTHDPDYPVKTIGGNNLDIITPDDRQSMGPLNLADSLYAPLTMDREDVISFILDPFEDTVQIIGFIQAKLYASSLPEGAQPGDPTDTDFIIRLLDVYPHGGEFLITEGNINARAREYVKSIANGQEDDDAPFSNIEADKIYEYVFNFLPTAYTFGKEHQLKILISSSNHPRFQSNSNIPLEDNEFFRRLPGENITYVFNNQEYHARTAVNSIHFSPEYPSQIILPLSGRQIAICGEPDSLFVTELTDSSAILNWRGASGTANYLVRYREIDAVDWIEVEVQNTHLALPDLGAGAFEWEVASLCADTMLFSISDTFSNAIPTYILTNEQTDYVTIFPNPAKDRVMVNVLKGEWQSEITIFSSDGQLVEQINQSDKSFKIDISDLAAGKYIIEFKSKDGKLLNIPLIKI